jgi:hypothetical protein
MSKQLFDDAIGEVPPSTVDVDAVVARGRRADRMRRVASPALATVAAVAVLLGGVAVVMLSGADADYAPAVPPGPTRTTSPAPTSVDPCEGTTPTGPPQPEEPAVTEDRLTAVLTELVSGELGPGATLEQNPIAKDRKGRKLGPLETYHWYSTPKPYDTGCQGGEDEYSADASVRSPDGVGSISVIVSRLGGWGGDRDSITCDDPGVAVDETACRTEATPDGDLIKLTSVGTGAAMKGSKTLRVDVVRADDTYVLIEAANMATSGKYPGPPTASKIPFTHDQLKEMALDPALTLYPK